MYPFHFYTSLFSLGGLSFGFHAILAKLGLEERMFQKYSVNLMRSIACYVLSTEGFSYIFFHPFYDCSEPAREDAVDLHYFFLAYLYFDTMILLYQYYLGIEKKVRLDLLLHHGMALFGFTYLQSQGIYGLTPYLATSEGLSIVTGPKMIGQLLGKTSLVKACIFYRLTYLVFYRSLFLWPFLFYNFYKQVGNKECGDGGEGASAYSYENLGILGWMILSLYGMEYYWYLRGRSEIKSIA